MKEPRLPTIKRLFTKAHDRCAFPNCGLPIAEESGTITGIICHIKARSKGGPRFDAAQTQEERHSFKNLVLMCARHSKIIDADPNTYSVEVLTKMKNEHEAKGWFDLTEAQTRTAQLLLEDYRSIYIDAKKQIIINRPEKVIFKGNKAPKIIPDGVIAGDGDKRGYIMYLVKRYHLFAKDSHPDYNFTVIHGCILRDFGKKIDHISLDLFPKLAQYLKDWIDDETPPGKRNKREKIPSYRSYEEYLADCLAAPRQKKKRKPKS